MISLGMGLLVGFLSLCTAKLIRTKIAILGGGMSGVMAANTLSQNGISDFLIIEAESVLGGRIKETTFDKYIIELGANWIAGIQNHKTRKENPIWTMAKKYNLSSTSSDTNNLLTYDQNGFRNYLDVVDRAFVHFDQVLYDAEKREESNLEDLSFADGQRLRGWMPETSYEKVADWWAFDFEFADTPSASSMIRTAANEKATHGQWSVHDQFVTDQRGYAFLVRQKAKTIATNKNILYNSIVTKVTYSNDSVNITLKDGLIIWADYAICTFSIGVLQHKDVQFMPQFPVWKQESIFSFKMVTYTKIFLQFSHKFWDNVQFCLYADPYRRGYYPLWQSLSEIGFLPDSNILVVTVVGDQALIVEAQIKNRTLTEIMEVLRSMYGNNIPEPNNFYYYRWTLDPLYRGSYSNWPTGTSQCQHQNLGRPVGRLHFAGEAYSREYYGFVHGAYIEGLKTGQKLADYVLGKTFTADNRDYSCKQYSSREQKQIILSLLSRLQSHKNSKNAKVSIYAPSQNSFDVEH
ncbi:unnamed protein product [Rotaria sp. Silwood2]|nr:unnamed protein product [Rotaria sp. Silwood2]CAF3063911.1 unnamed protein product [Rotaria sp. Silwood2]CAF3317373.1 unnamed protein product [Rotaria sp. Silwood2]CAF3393733.1 unnamed protein product [Rotaria sp. Silwood2]CAF4208825.1 unnamed protein product [Rotaria sp. Silwood2]